MNEVETIIEQFENLNPQAVLSITTQVDKIIDENLTRFSRVQVDAAKRIAKVVIVSTSLAYLKPEIDEDPKHIFETAVKPQMLKMLASFYCGEVSALSYIREEHPSTYKLYFSNLSENLFV